MFDYAWDLAQPMPGARRDISQDRQLLILLASGFKDEAIARYLGWGLRTVRRRVAKLMDDLGAQTRFQLGAAAQSRGLLKAGVTTSSG
jgi:DNA-binding NarL/FixJ family response regulator